MWCGVCVCVFFFFCMCVGCVGGWVGGGGYVCNFETNVGLTSFQSELQV